MTTQCGVPAIRSAEYDYSCRRSRTIRSVGLGCCEHAYGRQSQLSACCMLLGLPEPAHARRALVGQSGFEPLSEYSPSTPSDSTPRALESLSNRPVQILPLNKNITFHKRLAYMVRRTVAPIESQPLELRIRHTRNSATRLCLCVRCGRSVGYSRRSAQCCTDRPLNSILTALWRSLARE